MGLKRKVELVSEYMCLFDVCGWVGVGMCVSVGVT